MQKKYSEIKPGEVFAFGGQNWIRLEEAGLCVMEDILEERAFDEENRNDWGISDLREYLNNDFYELLLENGAKEEDFALLISDLTSDDGMKNYNISEDTIALLTADLYRRNRHLLKPLKSWWWLITPYSCISSNSYYVRYVFSSGTLHSGSAYGGYIGVRPLCNLSSETLVSVPGEEEEAAAEMNTTELIKKWAKDRGLDKADPKAQMVKLLEELGELANGINKKRQEQIIDSIGDVYVTLVILAMQHGMGIEDCIKAAYNEIKDRKGKMIDGVFVKKEDCL